MASLAVFASGSGSNFEAIAEAVAGSRHTLSCLVCDRPGAGALDRAKRLGVPSHVVEYRGRSREEAEREILRLLGGYAVGLVALAGYMRLLTPLLVDRYLIVNIHPALLPRHPGAHGLAESFNSPDTELGITIHRVDHGMDTGPTIRQERFKRTGDETIDEIECAIHDLEHRSYPKVIVDLLDGMEREP